MHAQHPVVLHRFATDDQGTVGALYYLGKKICYMLELPDRDNLPTKSRIPAGTYHCVWMLKSASGKYRRVWHLLAVLGRSGILAHPGNYAGDTTKGYITHSLGCLLPCLRIGRLKGQTAGLNSRSAMSRLRELFANHSFTLKVL